MLKLAHAVFAGLIGAAMLHIVIVLALPAFSERNAYSRVLTMGPAGAFRAVPANGPKDGPVVPNDPFVNVSACAFDLSKGPVSITAAGKTAFWSFSVFDTASSEVFSINDRSAEGGRLDAVLALPVQAAQLRKSSPERMERTVLIEMGGDTGYAILRTVSPHESMRPLALEFLKNARCGS